MTPSGYLVKYGRHAFVGLFDTPQGWHLQHGDRVVLQTPRGLELGCVLCQTHERFSNLINYEAGGQIVRIATHADKAMSLELESATGPLLAEADALANQNNLPVTFLDGEFLLDRSVFVIHVLPLSPCNLDSFIFELSEKFGFSVRVLDLSQEKSLASSPPSGCGKPNCSSTSSGCSDCGSGGGCSTGGCSSGNVTPRELTDYFVKLRSSVEPAHRRSSLL